MATETRKRYKSHKDYVTPKQVERAARVGGSLEESEYDEVEVINIDDPTTGEPKRITKDMQDSFTEVHTEMDERREGEADEGHQEEGE
jgi:hypothetical protein